MNELQELISSADFAELMIAEQLRPHGPERLDAACAVIASVIANVNRDSKSKPYTFKDFMLEYTPEETDEVVELSLEDTLAFFVSLTTGMGGEVVQRGDDRPDGGNPDGRNGGVHEPPRIG